MSNMFVTEHPDHGFAPDDHLSAFEQRALIAYERREYTASELGFTDKEIRDKAEHRHDCNSCRRFYHLYDEEATLTQVEVTQRVSYIILK